VVFGATSVALRPAKIKVPESPEVLSHKELTTS
jgi:hypothetical protein